MTPTVHAAQLLILVVCIAGFALIAAMALPRPKSVEDVIAEILDELEKEEEMRP